MPGSLSFVSMVVVLSGCIGKPPATPTSDSGCAECDTGPADAGDVATDGAAGPSPTHRKRLTIPKARVTGKHERFPVYLRHTDEHLRDLVSDETQIRFTDSEGAPIPHEIEAYQPTTGAIEAWVRLPRVSGTEDTDFFLEYFAPGATPPGVAGVWEDYVAVYHLGDETMEDGATISDSTANENDGTAVSTNQETRIPDGLLGAAAAFDGVDDYIEIPDNGTFQTPTGWTVSAWVEIGDVAEFGSAVSKPVSSAGPLNNSWQIFFNSAEEMLTLSSHGGASVPGASDAIPMGTWTHVAYVFDGEMLYHRVNGQTVWSESQEAPADFNSDPVLIGAERDEGSMLAFFPGTIDEVRVTSRPRSAEWLATEVENQQRPRDFVSWASLEEVP